MIRVSIVETHAVQRIGLKALLEADPSVIVVDTSHDLRLLDLGPVDVLLLSYCAICDLPPITTVAELAAQHRVVLYSGKETPISLLAYERTEVRALLHQSESEEQLLGSIVSAHADEKRSGASASRSVTGLSERESLVLALVGDGYTNDQIARRVGISRHTVDTYLRRIRKKLNLGNKAQLAKAAMHFSGGQEALPTQR